MCWRDNYGVSLPGVSLPVVMLLLGVSAPVVVLESVIVPLPELTSVEVETSTLLGAGGWQPMAAASMTTEKLDKSIRHNFTAKILLACVENGF